MITFKQIALSLIFSGVVLAQTSPYPAALDTDVTLKVAANGVSNRISTSIDAAVTTFTVSSCMGLIPNLLITIEFEIVPVTSCNGNTLIVASRGFDGTEPAAHPVNATVKGNVEAWNINAPNSAVKAIETALGVNLSNVGGGIAPYSVTVAAQTTLTVAAATHGKGAKVLPACVDTTVTPAVGVSCSFTINVSGDVVFSWAPAFTGYIVII